MVVRAGGNDYVGVADAIRRCADSLRALDAGGSRGSESVEALLETRDDILSKVEVAEGRYRSAGNALVEYAGALERAQTDSLNALAAAKSAQQDVDEAVGRAARMRESAGEYPEQGDGADDRARYERAATAADGDAEVARGRVRAQRQVVLNAMGERDAAAVKAMNAIDGAGDDGLGDSWWDDWGSKIVSWIATICDLVAQILGVLALLVAFIPLIGQALSAVLLTLSAIAGVVGAIAHIALAVSGDETFLAALVSVAFATLGCIGFGGMRLLTKHIISLSGLSRVRNLISATFGRKGIASTFENLREAFKDLARVRALPNNALGGVRGMARAYFRNVIASVRNLARYARVRFQYKGTPPRYTESKPFPRRPKTPPKDLSKAWDDIEPRPRLDRALPGNPDNLTIEADHIVPAKRIEEMDGYSRLTGPQRQEVMNWMENLQAITKRANRSRQNSLYVEEWLGYNPLGDGVFEFPADRLFLTQMQRLEPLLATRIQYMIDQIVAGGL